MITHVTIEVSDLERSASFYDALFSALGWRRHADDGGRVGWGISRAWFYVSDRGPVSPGSERVCFAAAGMAAVKAAWEKGVEAGGSDEGQPSVRPEFGSGYYCAYLSDPDGYRLEIAAQRS